MVKHSIRSLDMVFNALADPTRRAIVDRLAAGEETVSSLAAPFDISLPAVSKHIDVLEQAGLVHRRKEGRMQFCSLAEEPFDEAMRWLEQYRAFWEPRLDALERHLLKKK